MESEVEFVQKIIHTVRSARSDYNLPNKAKTEGTVYSSAIIYGYSFIHSFFI